MRVVLLAIMIFGLSANNAASASLEAMAGQMVLVGFQGKGVSQAGVQAVTQDIAAGRIGGVLYLRNNIASQNSALEMNRAFLRAGSIVPLITIDQEGGSIERLTNAVGFKEIPSAANIASNYNPGEATQIYNEMAEGLKGLGFNTNLGPVVDLNINPNNPIIARYGRSYGADSDLVTIFAGSFINAHRSAGVLTALKHFPGHGSSRTDSHEGFVDISDTWQSEELLPFGNLIEQNLVDIVMTAHLYHSGISETAEAQLPASLSKAWIEGMLRGRLGFDGVVISDDLEMSAIRSHYSMQEAIILAVEAGTDILLFSNTANYRTSLAREVVEILVAKAQSSDAFRARIEQSYNRIVRLKNTI